MTKMTKKDYFNALRARVADDADLVAFIDHELELLAKKNERKSDKPTAKQAENAVLIDTIYENMVAEKAYTVTDLMNEIDALNGLKVQKVSALVTKMREKVLVSREVVKGKAYFTKI